MLLKQIFSGTKSSEFILFKETSMVGSGNLLKDLVKQNLSRGNTVHFFSFGNRLIRLFNSFKEFSNFIVYDMFPSLTFLDEYKSCPELDQIFAHDKIPEKAALIIVDFVNIFIQIYGISYFTTVINQTKAKTLSGEQLYQVAGVVNWEDEALSETALGKQVERLAKTILTLSAPESGSSPTVSVLHKKSSGRHLKQICEWSMTGNSVEIREVPKEVPQAPAPVELDTPKPLTTFRIELDEQEKASRDNLVLPYMTHLKGRIHYVPDENDDWDDEDPDDDLDI